VKFALLIAVVNKFPMSRLIKTKRFIVIVVLIAITAVSLTSCHTDGCPNKITQVNPFGAGDVS
jgi:hypothetical protein